MDVRTGMVFADFLDGASGVSKGYLQGYPDFLSRLLNERGRWLVRLLSDHSGTRAICKKASQGSRAAFRPNGDILKGAALGLAYHQVREIFVQSPASSSQPPFFKQSQISVALTQGLV